MHVIDLSFAFGFCHQVYEFFESVVFELLDLGCLVTTLEGMIFEFGGNPNKRGGY
jgi:hypothetical protein